MSELSSGLWVPGQELEPPSAHPTPEEFRMRFVTAVWDGEGEPRTINFDDCLSALRYPEKTPTAVAFIDLDEVLGNLGYSLRLLQHQSNDKQLFTHDYGLDMFFSDADPIKQSLMGLVKKEEQPGIGQQPVEHAEVIASMLRSWRAAGVYVTCITSPVLGAELSSVDFLGRHFKGAFDGIVATASNYKLADKGIAATNIVDFIGLPAGAPAVHIDDLPHNTRKVREALATHPNDLQVATFQHAFDHPSHVGADLGSQQCATPLETMVQANDFFAKQLNRTLHIPLTSMLEVR